MLSRDSISIALSGSKKATIGCGNANAIVAIFATLRKIIYAVKLMVQHLKKVKQKGANPETELAPSLHP